MFSPFPLLQTAWDFYRKQTILNQVVLWLLVLPMFFLKILGHLLEPASGNPWPTLNPGPGLSLLLWLATLALAVLVVWGQACVLLIGKRLIKSPADRSRTSFSAVRTQAAAFIVPLIVTSILHGIFLAFWTLLLIVPGVIFFAQTSFFNIAVVCEKKFYRSAFRRSREVMRGRTRTVFASIVLLSFAVFFPISLLSGFATLLIGSIDEKFLPIADGLSALLFSFGSMLYLLAQVEMYAQLRGEKKEEIQSA